MNDQTTEQATLTQADAAADLAGEPRPDNPSMPAHQSRVHAEHTELMERTQKLEAFTGGDIFRTLDHHEQASTSRQLNHMRGYRDVLAERIAAF